MCDGTGRELCLCDFYSDEGSDGQVMWDNGRGHQGTGSGAGRAAVACDSESKVRHPPYPSHFSGRLWGYGKG